MGIKECKIVITTFLVFCVLCSNPVTLKASTAEDVYHLYGEEILIEDYEEHLSIIQRYNEARRYVTMYQYIIYSDFDTSILENRITELESKLASVKNELLSGYNKPLETIYKLEALYVEYERDLSEAKKSLVTYEISAKAPTVDTVPTYSEYLRAKDIVRIKDNIGELNIAIPVSNPVIEVEKTNAHVTYRTISNSEVKAMLSGRIAQIKNGTVTINHGANIYSLYDGLDSVDCKKGQYVTQGDIIGKSKDIITFKLKVDGTLVDVTKLFKKEDS